MIGGEPLLNFATYSVIEDFHEKFNISLSTNGTITPSLKGIGILKKLSRLCISVDTISHDVGMLMRGGNYAINDILNNLERYLNTGLCIEINTVVTTKNFQHLRDLANYISSQCPPLKWRLFQVTFNENVSIEASSWAISISKLKSLASELQNDYKSIDIQVYSSERLNNQYIIVNCYGDIFIPSLNNYQKLGHISDFNFADYQRQ